MACLVAALGTWLTYKFAGHLPRESRSKGFRWGQIGSASLVSLAHGTNDAQKTMGVITLALIAYGSWTDLEAIPLWVKVACALAIALGTYLGGWRVIRTLGKGLVEIDSPQGMAAEAASAAIILTSSHAGMALSTTHVATGSILGSGLGRKGAKVRWGVAARMVAAWFITLPAAGLMGAVCWVIADGLGGVLGVVVVTSVLILGTVAMLWRSQLNRVDHSNVNDDWPGPDKPALAASPSN